MPGRLLKLSADHAAGCAAHPRLPGYCPLIHVAHRSVIVRSVVADQLTPPDGDEQASLGHWFAIELGRLNLSARDVSRLRFLIGETDEVLEIPPGHLARDTGPLTVEDILADAHTSRTWITGETYVEAAAAGLRTETIVDMLYRDYLGRPADPNGLSHYASSIDAGTLTYDDIRRSFVEADEYRMRRKYVDSAPGSIFSQRIVLAAAPGERRTDRPVAAAPEIVSATELLALDGEIFVGSCYRRLLRKEVDPAGLAHYLNELSQGVSKNEIVRRLANELEAITAGVVVTGLEQHAPVIA